MSEHAPRTFRPGAREDEPFIFASWLKTHHATGDWPHRVQIPRCVREVRAEENGVAIVEGNEPRCPCCKFSGRRYYDEHKHIVRRLVACAQTIVACNPNRPAQILGFITFDLPRTLHWVDVKGLYQRQGIATELIALSGLEAPILCSHWTVGASKLRRAGAPLEYDPMILGYPKHPRKPAKEATP